MCELTTGCCHMETRGQGCLLMTFGAQNRMEKGGATSVGVHARCLAQQILLPNFIDEQTEAWRDYVV